MLNTQEQNTPTLTEMLKNIKTQYLDARNIGVRKFSVMTRISRTRLNRFFEGTAYPNEDEIDRMSLAMEQIEAKAKIIADRIELRKIKEQYFSDMFKMMASENTNNLEGIIKTL